ncbi:hypothetical protein [Sphingomonas sp.]|jgi:hypothetical protein|uniref:hypothetical protein n=1 Tax=Sphingomonas sp. TaxID=28214 RepID=UPI0035C86515
MPDTAVSTLAERAKAFFSSTAGMIGSAAAAALVAGVTAAMSPIGDYLRNQLWPERIVVDQSIAVVERAPVPLRVALTDLSAGSGLSGGRVSIREPEDGSVVLHGPSTFSYPEAEGSIDLVPEGGPTVEGRVPGRSRLTVTVQTNRGRSFQGHIDVRTTASRPVASSKNLSADAWIILLNRREGAMTLHEEGNRFTGEAEMADDEVFSVKGWRDGETFHVAFYAREQSGHPAYTADGQYCEKNGWLIVNAKTITYRAGVPTPNPVPLQTMRERCPGFPASLAPLDGDGTFFASVATH